MPYIPHTSDDLKSMLETIGKKSIDDLFSSIPSKYRLKKDELKLSNGLSESEARTAVEGLAGTNKTHQANKRFLGAGSYFHFIPSAINHITMRSEFYTAYTPYQPEISQGTLQAVFEFQTMMTRLTGLDVSNASMYDGATALAEAILVAYHYKRDKKRSVVIPKNLHPEYFDVLKNYLIPFGMNLVQAEFDKTTGSITNDEVKKHITSDTFAVVVQSPNFYGVIEQNAAEIAKTAKDNDAVPIMLSIESTSLGMFKPAGELGFDIAVLEIQSFGNPVAFGGPYAGVIVCKKEFTRNMPGRIIGETKDIDGKRAFVLTLATREQHIRREKATSNICSNQALVALRSSIYLTLMGEDGLKELAKTNYALAHYANDALAKVGAKAMFSGVFYNEFAVQFSSKAVRDNVCQGLKTEGFLPGYKLGENGLLITVTELNDKAGIEAYVDALGRYSK